MENKAVQELKKAIQKEEIFLSDYREQLSKVKESIQNSELSLKRLNTLLIELQRSFLWKIVTA